MRSDPQERQLKIISGGQTGVDRAALDAALASGVPCGGWCPAGRKAEDGRISDRYPLAELPGGDYRERTFKNVESSDASLIIAFGKPSGGTAQAVDFCRRLNKPFLVVDATAISVEEALSQALAFLGERKVTRLNVAGPRASSDARGYGFTFDLVNRLLARVP